MFYFKIIMCNVTNPALKKGVTMNKPEYETPKITVSPLRTEDVITTSGGLDRPDYGGEWDPIN